MSRHRLCSKFITFEGPDGSGKSTNVGFFVEQLRQRGYHVVQTREPGGTPLGEKMRTLFINEKMNPTAEALLIYANRSQHISELIVPSLEAGSVVVSERFADSSYAYQGAGRNNVEVVLQLEKIACGDIQPAHTLFFHITEDESLKRIEGKGGATDKFEAELLAFHKDVYHGYMTRLKMHAHRMRYIDGMVPIVDVQEQLVKFIDNVFVPRNPLPVK